MNKVFLTGSVSSNARQLKNGIAISVFASDNSNIPVYAFNLKDATAYTKGRLISIEGRIVVKIKDTKTMVYIVSDKATLLDTPKDSSYNDVDLVGEVAEVTNFYERGIKR